MDLEEDVGANKNPATGAGFFIGWRTACTDLVNGSIKAIDFSRKHLDIAFTIFGDI